MEETFLAVLFRFSAGTILALTICGQALATSVYVGPMGIVFKGEEPCFYGTDKFAASSPIITEVYVDFPKNDGFNFKPLINAPFSNNPDACVSLSDLLPKAPNSQGEYSNWLSIFWKKPIEWHAIEIYLRLADGSNVFYRGNFRIHKDKRGQPVIEGHYSLEPCK